MIQVQLIGLGRDLIRLEENVKASLSNPPFNIRWVLINSTNAIMDSKVEKIPSVTVNGKLLAEGRIPAAHEIRDMVYASFFESLKWKDVNRILVPTDFSSASDNALSYAGFLASHTGADITLVHVSRGLDFEEGTPKPVPKEELEKRLFRQMRTKANRILGHESAAGLVLKLGSTVDHLVNMSGDYDLIIMGATGVHETIGDKLFGGISSAVAYKSECPVLLIPKEFTEPRSLDKIMFTFKEGNFSQVDMDGWVKLTEKDEFEEVRFVTVNPDESEMRVIEEGISKEVKESVHDKVPFRIVCLRGKSIVDSLNDYAKKNEMDAMVMVAEKRRPLNAFFHRSQTKAMAMRPEIPVLIMHK